jgi:hypothetical protein
VCVCVCVCVLTCSAQLMHPVSLLSSRQLAAALLAITANRSYVGLAYMTDIW